MADDFVDVMLLGQQLVANLVSPSAARRLVYSTIPVELRTCHDRVGERRWIGEAQSD
jgi:hypothetical protein